jgi:uncharacterized protein YjdB
MPSQTRHRLSFLTLVLLGIGACDDPGSTPQPTSLDPGDRFAEVFPEQVSDLSALTLNHRAVELSWTEVDDGKGAPAQYQVRILDDGAAWDQGVIVREGACGYPVRGGGVGATTQCIIAGLEAGRSYRFAVGSERPDLTGTVQGAPSLVAFSTTRDEPVIDVPAQAEVVSGTQQSGTVGQALNSEVRVSLRDSTGAPMAGVSVIWASGHGGGTTASPLSLSDEEGIARTVWTLGPEAGPQSLAIRVPGWDDLDISADAAPGPVDRVQFLVDSTTVDMGEERRLAVQGWDEFGNLVEELDLEWQTSNPAVAEVDDRGVVKVNGRGWVWIRARTRNRWRKDKTQDSTTVVVEADPSSVSDLELEGDGPSWLRLRLTEVDDGTGDAADYAVRVGTPGTGWDDATEWGQGSCGSPMAGTAIGAERSCTIEGLEELTTYVAFVRPFRAKSGERVYAKTAASATGTTLEAPSVPAGVAPESGEGQIGIVGAPLPSPVVVRVRDANGDPVSGARVSFVPSDGGSVSESTSVSDDEGRAEVSWTLGSKVGTQSLLTSVEDQAGAPAPVGFSVGLAVAPVTIAASASAGPAATLELTPVAVDLGIGETRSFSLRAVDAFGNVTSASGVTWTTGDPSVATVTTSGGVAAVGAGKTKVRAVLGGVSSEADVSVQASEQPATPDPQAISDLRVVRETASSITVEFTEVDDGTGHAAFTELRWAFSPMGWGWAQANVVDTGACATPIVGSTVGATRRCVIDGLPSATRIDIQAVTWRVDQGNSIFSTLSNKTTETTAPGSTPSTPAVNRVHLTPPSVTLDQAGQNHQFYAVAYDASDTPISTPIVWTSSDPAVATVSQGGLVTARTSGLALITAAALCCTAADSSQVTVALAVEPPPPPPTATSIQVLPPQVTFDQVGQSLQLSALVFDASNSPFSTGISWSSSNPAVASVGSDGTVTARAVGSASITASASCCGLSAVSQITVSAPQPPPPPPPSGLWQEQTWNFPDQQTMHSTPGLEAAGNAGGLGASRPVTLPAPGPWGGSRALENYFGTIPADWQPQVATNWYFPATEQELWIETWIRFAPEWSIGPGNPTYAAANGNVDHKTIFLWEEGWRRWEVKFGPNAQMDSNLQWVGGGDCVASAASHDIFYGYLTFPDSRGKCNAERDVWDGQWHRFRIHARMGTTDGQMQVWWDDSLVIDRRGLNTQSGSSKFMGITFGGNRNQGTNHPMSFFYGPARLYRADPGW